MRCTFYRAVRRMLSTCDACHLAASSMHLPRTKSTQARHTWPTSPAKPVMCVRPALAATCRMLGRPSPRQDEQQHRRLGSGLVRSSASAAAAFLKRISRTSFHGLVRTPIASALSNICPHNTVVHGKDAPVPCVLLSHAAFTVLWLRPHTSEQHEVRVPSPDWCQAVVPACLCRLQAARSTPATRQRSTTLPTTEGPQYEPGLLGTHILGLPVELAARVVAHAGLAPVSSRSQPQLRAVFEFMLSDPPTLCIWLTTRYGANSSLVRAAVGGEWSSSGDRDQLDRILKSGR